MIRNVLALALCVAANTSDAQSSNTPQTISVECAHRDLALITELDSARDAKAPVSQLVLASQLLQKARKLCISGDDTKAFKIYDTAIGMLQDRPIWFRETGD